MRIYISTMLFFSCFWSIAQDLETDRPDQTESSATVPKGMFQIETGVGVALVHNTGTGLSDRTFFLPTTLFRIALVNKLELRVVNTLTYFKTGNIFTGQPNPWNIDDLQLGFKGQFLAGDGVKPQVSLMAHVVLPTGNGVNLNYGAISKLLISHDFSNGMALGYNVGYNHFGTGDGDLTYSLSLAAPATEKLGVYIETYGEYVDFNTYVSSADAGLTFLVRPHIQLDYSFGLGINHRMNYQAIGLSIRFPK